MGLHLCSLPWNCHLWRRSLGPSLWLFMIAAVLTSLLSCDGRGRRTSPKADPLTQTGGYRVEDLGFRPDRIGNLWVIWPPSQVRPRQTNKSIHQKYHFWPVDVRDFTYLSTPKSAMINASLPPKSTELYHRYAPET